MGGGKKETQIIRLMSLSQKHYGPDYEVKGPYGLGICMSISQLCLLKSRLRDNENLIAISSVQIGVSKYQFLPKPPYTLCRKG